MPTAGSRATTASAASCTKAASATPWRPSTWRSPPPPDPTGSGRAGLSPTTQERGQNGDHLGVPHLELPGVTEGFRRQKGVAAVEALPGPSGVANDHRVPDRS